MVQSQFPAARLESQLSRKRTAAADTSLPAFS
jgi:hypothetical protein